MAKQKADEEHSADEYVIYVLYERQLGFKF